MAGGSALHPSPATGPWGRWPSEHTSAARQRRHHLSWAACRLPVESVCLRGASPLTALHTLWSLGTHLVSHPPPQGTAPRLGSPASLASLPPWHPLKLKIPDAGCRCRVNSSKSAFPLLSAPQSTAHPPTRMLPRSQPHTSLPPPTTPPSSSARESGGSTFKAHPDPGTLLHLHN